jgi:hypothetical protein
MTRKDYEAFAALLRDEEVSIKFAEKVADIFAADNPRFDREKFLIASGIEVDLTADFDRGDPGHLGNPR